MGDRFTEMDRPASQLEIAEVLAKAPNEPGREVGVQMTNENRREQVVDRFEARSSTVSVQRDVVHVWSRLKIAGPLHRLPVDRWQKRRKGPLVPEYDHHHRRSGSIAREGRK